MLPPDQEQKINALIFSGTAENIELALQLAKGLGAGGATFVSKIIETLGRFWLLRTNTRKCCGILLQKIKETGLTMRPDQSHSYYDKETCFENLDWKILAPIVESLSIYAVDDDFL